MVDDDDVVVVPLGALVDETEGTEELVVEDPAPNVDVVEDGTVLDAPEGKVVVVAG